MPPPSGCKYDFIRAKPHPFIYILSHLPLPYNSKLLFVCLTKAMTVRFLHCKDPLFSYSFGHSYSFILSHSWLYLNTLFLPQNLHLKCLSSTVWIATLRIKNWGWWDVPADKRSCCTWVQIPEIPCRHICNPRAATKEGKVEMGGCYSCRTQHNDRETLSNKVLLGCHYFKGSTVSFLEKKQLKEKLLSLYQYFHFILLWKFCLTYA